MTKKKRATPKVGGRLTYQQFVAEYGSAIRDGAAADNGHAAVGQPGPMPWDAVKNSWLIHALKKAAAEKDPQAYKFLLWCALSKLQASPPDGVLNWP